MTSSKSSMSPGTRSLLFFSIVLHITAATFAEQVMGLPERQEIEIARVEILDSPYQEFDVGERFVLNVDDEQLLDSGGAKGVRFRVFAGSREDLIKRRGVPTNDGCLLFASRSYKAKVASGGVDFQFSFGLNWLEIKQKVLVDGVYLLVIEKANATGDHLKLNKEHVDRYFQRGFPFVVRKPRFPSLEEVTRTIAGKSLRKSKAFQKARELAAATAYSETCKTFVHVLVAETMTFKPRMIACRDKKRMTRPYRTANNGLKHTASAGA